MLIIGERLNSNHETIRQAMRDRNAAVLRAEASMQAEAGVHYLDVNAAELRDDEVAAFVDLVPVLQDASGLPLAIDSPSPAAMQAALQVHRGRALLNSITGEKERLVGMMPLVAEYRPRVVALCMDDQGMPTQAADRVRVAAALVNDLVKLGIAEADIFLDPLVKPIGVDPGCGIEVLESIAALRRELPNCHITMGLSNVSFGMPKGKWLNRALLAMAMWSGLDSVFCDPADRHLLALLRSARVLLGHDEFGLEYLAAARAGNLEY